MQKKNGSTHFPQQLKRCKDNVVFALDVSAHGLFTVFFLYSDYNFSQGHRILKYCTSWNCVLCWIFILSHECMWFEFFFLIHMSNIWIYVISCVHLSGQLPAGQPSCVAKTLMTIHTRFLGGVCFMLVVERNLFHDRCPAQRARKAPCSNTFIFTSPCPHASVSVYLCYHDYSWQCYQVCNRMVNDQRKEICFGEIWSRWGEKTLPDLCLLPSCEYLFFFDLFV